MDLAIRVDNSAHVPHQGERITLAGAQPLQCSIKRGFIRHPGADQIPDDSHASIAR